MCVLVMEEDRSVQVVVVAMVEHTHPGPLKKNTMMNECWIQGLVVDLWTTIKTVRQCVGLGSVKREEACSQMKLI